MGARHDNNSSVTNELVRGTPPDQMSLGRKFLKRIARTAPATASPKTCAADGLCLATSAGRGRSGSSHGGQVHTWADRPERDARRMIPGTSGCRSGAIRALVSTNTAGLNPIAPFTRGRKRSARRVTPRSDRSTRPVLGAVIAPTNMWKRAPLIPAFRSRISAVVARRGSGRVTTTSSTVATSSISPTPASRNNARPQWNESCFSASAVAQ